MVNLYGLLSIQSKYFPYVMPAMDMLNGSPIGAASTFTGIIVGHLWWMIEYQGPQRSAWGKAPAWVVGLFESGRPGGGRGGNEQGNSGSSTATNFGTATAPRGRALGDRSEAPRTVSGSGASGSQHQWGSGRRLG